MGFLSRKVRDHRGTRVPLYATGLTSGLASDRRVVPREVFVRVRRELNRGGRRNGWWAAEVLLAVPFLPVLGCVIVSYALHASGRSDLAEALTDTPAMTVVLVCAVGAYAVLAGRGLRFFSGSAIVTEMLRVQRCASCGYDLRAIAPDAADGCCVCPECGAAWRLTAIGQELPHSKEQDDGGAGRAQGVEAGRGSGG